MMYFLLDLAGHGLAGAFIGHQFDAPLAGMAAGIGAHLAGVLVYCLLPDGEES